MDPTTIGVGLAKRVFAVYGVDRQGNTKNKKTLRCNQVIHFFTKLPSCTIAMETCESAHNWARILQSLSHQVRLIAPQSIRPNVKGNKHDEADAAAICGAASPPSTRFVAVKSITLHAVLALHRA